MYIGSTSPALYPPPNGFSPIYFLFILGAIPTSDIFTPISYISLAGNMTKASVIGTVARRRNQPSLMMMMMVT